MSIRTALIVLLLICSPLISAPAFAADADVTGKWTCVGESPNGAAYKGSIVVEKSGDYFIVHWTVGAESYDGIALLTDGVLSVGWTVAGKPSVVAYRVQGDTATGRWVMPGVEGKTFSERWTREK